MADDSRFSEEDLDSPSTPHAASHSASNAASNAASNVGSETAPDATSDSSDSDTAKKRRGPPPNPLYHPLFLPVLLVAYTLWFGYDGFLTGPEYEHRTFNQIMFAVTAAISLWVVPRGVREYQREREAAGREQAEGKPPGSPLE